MKIHDYNNYISESKLELLLETNIQYLPRFIEVLNQIPSTVSSKLLHIFGKEVDINTTYVDISPDKDDVVTFVPDSKLKGLRVIVTNGQKSRVELTQRAQENKTYPINNHIRVPLNRTIGEIVKILTVDELNKISKNYSWGERYADGRYVAHFRWNDRRHGICEILIDRDGLIDDVSEVQKSEIRIGRFVRRVIDASGQSVTDKEIEDFVNRFKAALAIRKNAFDRFRIVNGEQIRKYYLADFYDSKGGGSLHGSCMRYSKCQPFFDIYVKNPDFISMVLLMAKSGEDKISGRAILWKDNKDRLFMDRIYTCNPADEALFKEYAIREGFYYKNLQNNQANMELMFNDKREENNLVVVKLNEYDYNTYPYMDTLKFYIPETGIISNKEGSEYRLESTRGGNGSCERCDGTGRVNCGDCDGSGRQECGSCDGEGMVSCDTCGGRGSKKCQTCGGKGVDSESNKCPNCNGNGVIICPDCEDGRVECGDCDGSGNVSCYDCDGRGWYDCPDCG